MDTTQKNSLAWRVMVAGYDNSSSSKNGGFVFAKTLHRSLSTLDLWDKDEIVRFYEAIIEGVPSDVSNPEITFGPVAFETLVQDARRKNWFWINSYVLGLVRQISAHPSLSFEDVFGLLKLVTKECRERYAPHKKLPKKPPEVVDSKRLSLERMGEISIRLYQALLNESLGYEYSKTIGRIRYMTSLIEEGVLEVSKVSFLHDLQEGSNLSYPKHGHSSPNWLAFERNRAVALATAMVDFRYDDLGFEDIVKERVKNLADKAKITTEEAGGFLIYLARERLDPGCDP